MLPSFDDQIAKSDSDIVAAFGSTIAVIHDGNEYSIKVIVDTFDPNRVGFGDGFVQDNLSMITGITSEIDFIKRGDKLIINGEIFSVKTPPIRHDENLSVIGYAEANQYHSQ